jgi:Asp-tRNA(Asn)/Glu-tRNA(Gln) amidotransferase A subunit family amidase
MNRLPATRFDPVMPPAPPTFSTTTRGLCGVFAIKPSHGLVSRAGVLQLSRKLDHIGAFARSLSDLALILDSPVMIRATPTPCKKEYQHFPQLASMDTPRIERYLAKAQECERLAQLEL